MVTVVDEVAVLAHRDDTGRSRVRHLQLALAGAVLMELSLRSRIDIGSNRRVTVIDTSPTGDTVLDSCLQRIDAGGNRKAKTWVKKLARGLNKQVLAGLVDRRVLNHQRDAVLGLIPLNRHRPVDGRLKAAIRSRLETAMAREAAPDTPTAALSGVIYAAAMHRHALPGHPRAVRKVLRTIGDGPHSTEATRQATYAIRKAISDANSAAANAGGGGGG